MPLYEYECEACGHHLEAQQRLADAPLTKCPECGKKKLQKLISATAFHLKGGGWYKDLYSSQKPEGGSGGPAAETKAEATVETKTETKTETTAAAKSDETVKKPDKKKGGSGSSSSGSGSGGGSAKKPTKGGSSASASI